MTEFYVGQKVVCIRSKPSVIRQWPITHPVMNGIYTIRHLETFKDEDGCRLVEIVNPIYPYYDSPMPCEVMFAISRFRPLESKAIQLFRKIAADATEKCKITVRA